ncbi:MAG: 30S ribosomal protein S12 methylthiotransferase RimO [Helicobacteraceae bacterium]|nr:30S ribosomal protein S12 methylthiotransferase RimO [Helicobacteraceae bacterium]
MANIKINKTDSVKTLCLISLGCTKNLVDSEVMLGKLKDYTLINSPKQADLIIINTCGFIASAKQESIEKILEVGMQKKKGAILVVSGCLSERYANELKEEIREIDIISGVGDYNKIDLMIKDLQNKQNKIPTNSTSTLNLDSLNIASSNIALNRVKTFLIDKEERIVTGSKIHTYIKISEGCNQKCSFCAIPNIKGKLNSRSIESCINEMENLVKKGYFDFSFIAQDSSSYMRDLGKNDALVDLINEVEKIKGIRSARILYLYPSTTSNRLIERIIDSKVFQNYFDIPLQHISSSMLSVMKRGASQARHIELLNLMRSAKDSFIRTTFLLGHPKESESDFEELCDFVENFIFDRINIFAFSKEEGTKAYDMNDLPSKEVTNERIKKLDKIIQKQQKKLLKSYVGETLTAIIEGVSKESNLLYSARDVKWDREIDGEILINENLTSSALECGYYEVKVQDFNNGYLIGKAIKRL